MLIRDDGETWTAIGQPAHAWLAGQVGRAWAPAPEADVVLAIEQHDVAWSEWDRHPPLDARARRASAFLETPPGHRLEMWRHVAHRLEAQSPYAALLVSMHATNINTRYGDPATRPAAFLQEQAQDQEALLARLAATGVTRDGAARDADLLFLLDAISLALCHGTERIELPGPDVGMLQLEAVGDGIVTIDPWPLAVPELRAWLHARTFTTRFDDEAELHRALDEAPFERMEWLVRPA